jgi:hypothetical protein
MSITSTTGKTELEKLIMSSIPRDALMAFEDAYYDGDAKGRAHAANFAIGHRPSAAGHIKHFFCNESIHEAMLAHGADPTPLRGTKVVVGRLGIFNIVRLNVPGHKWVNLKRSASRKKLAELNDNIKKKYIQYDLFINANEVADGTIFVLGVMDGIDVNSLVELTQVMVALPAPDLSSWLYICTMADFLKLYDQVDAPVQQDKAVPKLKAQPKKKSNDDQGN